MIKEEKLNLIILLVLFVIPFLAYLFNEPYLTTLTTKIVILSIAGIGLNFILGYGGLVSFGHAAFFGIGGYVTGILASHAQNSEQMFFFLQFDGSNQILFIWLISIIICSFIALLIGYFSLRTSGVYFIMITLAFAQMLYYFSISWPAYGGEDGLSIYVRNVFPFFNTMNPINFYFICFTWLLIFLTILKIILNSSFGLVLKACKENEERVKSIGINPFNIKLISFVFSGAITGLAGSLYTDLNRFVSPSVLSWQMSGEIMVLVILGGVARLYGPILGAVFYIILEQTLGGISENWQFWLGLIIILEVLYARAGIMSLFLKDSKS
jgi:branched-chain amino acid transport system permease protein